MHSQVSFRKADLAYQAELAKSQLVVAVTNLEQFLMSVNTVSSLDEKLFSENNTNYVLATNPLLSSISFGTLAGVSRNKVLRSSLEWVSEDQLIRQRFSDSISSLVLLKNVSADFQNDPLAVVVSNMNPVAPNLAAIGLNLFTHPARRAFFNKSITTGKPVLTAPISLVQVPTSPGALFIVPYTSVLTGLVDLFGVGIIVGQSLIYNAGSGAVDISIFDTTDPSQPVILSASRCGKLPEANITVDASRKWFQIVKDGIGEGESSMIIDLVIHGRTWSLVVCIPEKRLADALARERSISKGFATTLATLMLGLSALLAVAAASYFIIYRKSGEIKRTRSQFKEAILERSVFMENLSSEILSPLSNMMGMLALLLDGGALDRQDVQDTRRDLSLLQSAGRSLGRVINDLFLFSRISSGDVVTIDKAQFDAEGAVREVCSLVAGDPMSTIRIILFPRTTNSSLVAIGDVEHVSELFNKIISLSSQLVASPGTRPGGPCLVIKFQSVVVSRVSRHLASPHRIELDMMDEERHTLWPAPSASGLGSAAAGLPRGGSTTDLATQQDFFEFTFVDNGVGLSPESVDAVNSGSLSSHTTKGLGLRLFVSIMEGMGGSVSVSSRENKGSTFSVMVPAVNLSLARASAGSELERADVSAGSISAAAKVPSLFRSRLSNEPMALGGASSAGRPTDPSRILGSLLAGWRVIIMDDAPATGEFFKALGLGPESLIMTKNLSTIASLVATGDPRPTVAVLGVTGAISEGEATRTAEKTVREVLQLQEKADCIFKIAVFHPSSWVAEMVRTSSSRPRDCTNLGLLLEVNHVASVFSEVIKGPRDVPGPSQGDPRQLSLHQPSSIVAAEALTPRSSQQLASRKVKALVVDDDPASAQTFLHTLQTLNVEAILAPCAGGEAQKIFKQLRHHGVPVVIFLDLGCEVEASKRFVGAVRSLETSKGWTSSPVVGLSTGLGIQDTDSFNDIVESIYPKPISHSDLKALFSSL